MNEAALSRVIIPALARHDLELDHLEIIPAGRRSIVRITVDGDGPEGNGPLLDDIAEASREVSAALDAEPSVGQNPYTLEVSSRGTGRPLTEPKHYRRNLGRLVKITTTEGAVVEGRITEITDADDPSVVLEVSDKDKPKLAPTSVSVPLAQVRKALIQVEMNRSLLSEDGYFDDLEEN